MISLFAAVSILGVSSFCFEFLPMLWWKSKFQSARSVMRLFSVREFAKPFSRPFESCSRNICYIYSLYKIQNQTTPSSQIVPKQHWRTNQPIEPSVVRPATFNHVQTQSHYPLWSYPTNHRMRTLPWTRPVIWSATAVGEIDPLSTLSTQTSTNGRSIQGAGESADCWRWVVYFVHYIVPWIRRRETRCCRIWGAIFELSLKCSYSRNNSHHHGGPPCITVVVVTPGCTWQYTRQYTNYQPQ